MAPPISKPQIAVLSGGVAVLAIGAVYLALIPEFICAPGSYDHDGDPGTSCEVCPAGKFSEATTLGDGDQTGCNNCRGWACRDCDCNDQTDADPTCGFADTNCMGDCPAGTYAPSGATGSSGCVMCATGESDDDSTAATPCVSCPAGRSTGANTTATVGSCPNCLNGTFSPGGVAGCADCSVGESSSAGAATCTTCAPGTFQSEAAQAVCLVCPPGSAASATMCTICTGGQVDEDGDSRSGCTNCPTGRYTTADGTVTTCPGICALGTYAAAGSSGAASCTDCSAGRTDEDSDPGSPCVACVPGRFENRSTTSGPCIGQCPEYSTGPVGAVSINECSASCGGGQLENPAFVSVQASPGVIPCIDCEAGSADADQDPTTTCTICPAGTFTDGIAATLCQNCPVGTFAPAGSGGGLASCVECSTGYADADSSPSTACTACSLGTFSAVSGLAACLTCPTGSVTYNGEVMASNAATRCTQCEAGQFSPDSQTACGECGAGLYGIAATSACIVCPPGSVTETLAAPGAEQCISCPVGQFSNSSQTVCQECPAGSVTNTLAAPGAALCTRCGANTYSKSPEFPCTGCDEGWRADAISRTCVPCPDGMKTDGGNHTYETCPVCPTEERCRCTDEATCCTPESNSEGNGCATCKCGYLTAGSRCLECPASVGGPLVAAFAVVMIMAITMLWRVTRVSDTDAHADSMSVEDMKGNLSNVALFGSIASNHLHLTMITFEMPFGWPRFLVELGSWLGNLFSFDFGRLMISPECNLPCDIAPEQSMFYKLLASHSVFLILMVALSTIGKVSLLQERRRIRIAKPQQPKLEDSAEPVQADDVDQQPEPEPEPLPQQMQVEKDDHLSLENRIKGGKKKKKEPEPAHSFGSDIQGSIPAFMDAPASHSSDHGLCTALNDSAKVSLAFGLLIWFAILDEIGFSDSADSGSTDSTGGDNADGDASKCRDNGNDCCANQAAGEPAQCYDGWLPSNQPQSYDGCPNYTCRMSDASPACQVAGCSFGCIRTDGSCDSHHGEWSADEWNNGEMDQSCQGRVPCAATSLDSSYESNVDGGDRIELLILAVCLASFFCTPAVFAWHVCSHFICPHKAQKASNDAKGKGKRAKGKGLQNVQAKKRKKDKPLTVSELKDRTMWIIGRCVVREKPDLSSDQVGRLEAGTEVRVLKAVTLADGTVRVGIDSIHDDEEEVHSWITYFAPSRKEQTTAGADGQGAAAPKKGDQVTWTKSDSDVPQGSVGQVLGTAHGGKLSIRFGVDTFNFRAEELIVIEVSGKIMLAKSSHNPKVHRPLVHSVPVALIYWTILTLGLHAIPPPYELQIEIVFFAMLPIAVMYCKLQHKWPLSP